MRMMRAGMTILAGTDTPNAANLHGELRSFVGAGMTPFQALQTATVNPARVLGIDAGSIEVGKLADLVLVDGNPLADVGAAHRVRQVVANGRVYTMTELLKQP
jgi:imidazolonepropionase-like amidohydrolase